MYRSVGMIATLPSRDNTFPFCILTEKGRTRVARDQEGGITQLKQVVIHVFRIQKGHHSKVYRKGSGIKILGARVTGLNLKFRNSLCGQPLVTSRRLSRPT